jgi:uncharacterized membrane protein
MSELVVIGFDDAPQAEAVRVKLLELQREHLIDLEDAVVAVKDRAGAIELRQIHNLTAAGAIGGGFWGALVGLIFVSPLLGMAVGAAAGAISGALSDVGIDDDFMRELASTLEPGRSALFVLMRKSTPDKVLEELRGHHGKVLRTSLSHDEEQRLREVLEQLEDDVPR